MRGLYHRVFGLLLVAASAVLGGQTLITGKEPRDWTEGNLSVVVGTLSELRPIAGSDYGLHEAVLLPSATLAGRFDPSLHPRLKVRLHIGGHGTSIERAPPSNAKVLAVIATNSMWRDEVVPSDWIESSICTFMPDYSALVVIDGLDDPRVAETLKRIQIARGVRKDATTQPSTQPAP